MANDLDENGKPKKKPLSKEAFIDIAIDHGVAHQTPQIRPIAERLKR